MPWLLPCLSTRFTVGRYFPLPSLIPVSLLGLFSDLLVQHCSLCRDYSLLTTRFTVGLSTRFTVGHPALLPLSRFTVGHTPTAWPPDPSQCG